LPPILRDLVPQRFTRAAAKNAPPTDSLLQRLRPLGEADRHKLLLDIACTVVSSVMGRPPADIPSDRPLKDIGLDSLMAVEIRRGLTSATQLRLRSTLLFDHPTLHAIAKFLGSQLFVDRPAPRTEVVVDESMVREALASIPIEELRQANLLDTLMHLAAQRATVVDVPAEPSKIATMSRAELIELARRRASDEEDDES
jgi:hypothetical protein